MCVEVIKNIVALALPVVSSIVTLIISNRYNSKQTDKQIKASERQAVQQYEFGQQKLLAEKNYANKAEIIECVLFIKNQNNLTKNYIMEMSRADEFTVNTKYEEMVRMTNRIIKNLYLSFPNFVEYGYKILGQCNMIWGNEKNCFGCKIYNPEGKVLIKEKLFSLYDDLNKLCVDFLDRLKEK